MSERQDHWPHDETARVVLRQIESLGYRVSCFHNPGSLRGTMRAFVEMHAVKEGGGEAHVARVFLEDESAPNYACACRLAESVGIDLEG